jgi:hypothetical protein
VVLTGGSPAPRWNPAGELPWTRCYDGNDQIFSSVLLAHHMAEGDGQRVVLVGAERGQTKWSTESQGSPILHKIGGRMSFRTDW